MNQQTIAGSPVIRKQMCNLGNGKGLLRFTQGRKKAFIEYYEPSTAYCRHMLALRAQEAAVKNRKPVQYPEMQLPTNSFKSCRYAAGNLFNQIFNELKAKSNGSNQRLREDAPSVPQRSDC